MTTTGDHGRFWYVARFDMPINGKDTLCFRAFNKRFAHDHAYHVAWQASVLVREVRRAQPDEILDALRDEGTR